MVGWIAGAPRVSAAAYFSGVALATALGIAAVVLLRPAFEHTVLQLAGLEGIPQATPNSFYAVCLPITPSGVLRRETESDHDQIRWQAFSERDLDQNSRY